MPPKPKIKAWQYAYSIVSVSIMAFIAYSLNKLPQLSGSKYKYLIILIALTFFIIIAELAFLRIKKITEDGNRRRNGSGG